jgi:DNA gyrase subunit A
VNKASLIEKIADLVQNKRLAGISDIRDESDREGMRVVIEVKRGELPEIILNNLYKHTQLQISFGIIMLAIVDKQPKTLGLLDMMKYFIAHRKEVILRRTRFELRKAEERAHILEGLVICLDNLDAVIKLIRAAKTVDEARKGLMEKFGLTQVQAQAVLELQLQRLAQLERLKIQEEYAALKKRITELRKILKDERLVFAIIVQELKEVKEEYGDERRTEIRDEAVSELRPEDLVKEEDVAIVYTSSGYIKRTSLTSYKFQARGGKGRRGIEMKAEDIVEDLYICSTHSYLLVFTNQGRLYWLKALDVPDVGVSGRGKPIANLLEFQPNEKPASVVAVKEFSENQFVVMLTTDGIIKKTRLSDFRNVRKGGILAMNIRPKSELFSAQLSGGKNNIVIGTRLGRALSFKESDVRTMGRTASGVRGIRLKPKDKVIGMIIVGPDDKFIFTATDRGYGKKTASDMYPIKHRGGQGVLNLRVTPKVGHALGMVGINEEDLLIITVEGKVIGIPTTQVRSSGRPRRASASSSWGQGPGLLHPKVRES